MKTRPRPLITMLVAFTFIVLSVLAVRCYFMGQSYRTDLEYTYTRALGELSESLDEMTVALDKSEYCTTPTMQLELATAVISAGSTAKSAAAALPFSGENSAAIEKLISVCQDYALFASKKLSAGEVFSDEDHGNLSVMGEYTSKLLESIDSIRIKLDETNGTVGQAERLLGGKIDIPDAEKFDSNLGSVTEELGSFPVLLYDGPFSDHITNMEPRFLEGKKDISREDAISIAARFMGVPKENLSCENEPEGTMAVYQVRGDNISVNVTKKGGEVSWAKKSGEITDSTMTYSDALEIAEDFLEKNGLPETEESYWSISDNTCTINFSAVQDDIILYPDLIKVTIELNEGGMVEYNAEGFIMNHHRRTEVRPAISEDEAESKVSPLLEVKEDELAVIPTPGKYEVLCYEFLCESEDGTQVLVYINAETGAEQQVFILQETEGGMLTS